MAAVTPLLGNLVYFATMAIAGWGLLSLLKVWAPNRTPRGIDMLFTAVSAATVSSMSTVEMEVFSNSQLIVLTALMLFGGEVFLSLVGLWLVRLREHGATATRGEAPAADATNDGYHIMPSPTEDDDPAETSTSREEHHQHLLPIAEEDLAPLPAPPPSTVVVAAAAVTAYFLFVHAVGVVAVAACIHAAPGARQTLTRKALDLCTFAAFTTVSTFSNCGYVPTNENMLVFAGDVPLQVLLAALTLAGNTLFPPLMAPCVGAARWLMERRREYSVVVVTRETTGYDHLLPPLRCKMLVVTVVGFIAVQAVLLCVMEWDGALQGLSACEKVVNAIFVAVNSRLTGESTVDLSTVAPAILVLFVLMMMQSHICTEIGKNVIYLSSMHIHEKMLLGFDVPDDHEDLKHLNAKEKPASKKRMLDKLKFNAASYVYRCMKLIEDKGSLRAAYCFGHGKGLIGHWITYIIYPQWGSAVVFDSLNYPKESYVEFERILNFAYKMYIKDDDSRDLRNTKNKFTFRNSLAIKCDFPILCFK